MIRVTAAARLHFGLLSLPAGGEQFWTIREGEPALPLRRFGGVGMMVKEPALRLRSEAAGDWSAEGPLAERALVFARRFAGTMPAGTIAPQRLVVESAPPEHSGFGTGTQLGLAVARALAVAAGCPHLDAVELAARTGRGMRSALGVHGFTHGGFLVEAGKTRETGVAPLVARLDFPDPWRVVLAIPPVLPGVHGEREREAFQILAGRNATPRTTEVLCRLVLLGLLPALIERDLETFGEALYDFNVRVGETFAAVQGGTYTGARVAEVVAFLRRDGVRGVAQSSWGPAVAAVVADEDQAGHLAHAVRRQFGLDAADVLVTRGCNRGPG